MNNKKKVTEMALFLPVFCMILVMAVNILYDAACGNFAFSFFTISIRNGVLYGRLIDILNRGSEIAILAIGMTLVVSASAGTDISEMCIRDRTIVKTAERIVIELEK